MVPQAAVSDCAKLDEVYAPPQEVFQGLLEIQEIGEAVRDARLEFHEQVDVTALGVKVPPQDRAEQLELAHAVKAAQSADFLKVVFDQRGHVPEPLALAVFYYLAPSDPPPWDTVSKQPARALGSFLGKSTDRTA